MRFIIERVSQNQTIKESEPPCEGAFLGRAEMFGEEQTLWLIDINDLYTLVKMAGVSDNEFIVSNQGKWWASLPKIRIYDGYIE